LATSGVRPEISTGVITVLEGFHPGRIDRLAGATPQGEFAQTKTQQVREMKDVEQQEPGSSQGQSQDRLPRKATQTLRIRHQSAAWCIKMLG